MNNLLAALPAMFASRRPSYRLPKTEQLLAQPKSAADMASTAIGNTVRQFNQAYMQAATGCAIEFTGNHEDR